MSRNGGGDRKNYLRARRASEQAAALLSSGDDRRLHALAARLYEREIREIDDENKGRG
jgi:hypothetical protein